MAQEIERYVAWLDGNKSEAVAFEVGSDETPVDKAAKVFGYLDYADMAQELNFGEGDGLNTCRAGEAGYHGVEDALT
jgi:hypothetical protein